MDTPISIKIHKYVYIGSSNEFKYLNTLVKEIDIEKSLNIDDNEMFSFSEYDRIELEFCNCSQGDSIEIECYGVNENNEVVYSKSADSYIHILHPGDRVLLSPGGDTDDMFVPGEYLFKINRKNKSYSASYKIKPSSAEWSSVIKMRSKLEEVVSGLAYNIYLERKGLQGVCYIENASLVEQYRYLVEVEKSLFSSLDAAINNPISDIESEYGLKDSSKKVDRKSQRWLVKKGGRYNSNIYQPNKFYEKHSVLTYDTRENKKLKDMLEYIQNIISEVSLEYSIALKYIKEKISEAEDSIKELEERRRYSNTLRNTSNTTYRLNNDIQTYKGELAQYIDKEKVVQELMLSATRMRNNMNYYLFETWLKGLSVSTYIPTTSSLMKNKYYNEIYCIYSRLRRSSEQGLVEVSFPYKKTSRLFEIYNFIIVKEILEELGFKWVDGWLKSDIMTASIKGDLESGDYIVLKKEDFKIKLIYDKLLNRSGDIRGSSESQISVPAIINNTRPDILIEVYKGDEFVTGIVVEVKYRKKAYIYNKYEDTNVVKQLSSYRNLEYHDGRFGRVNTRIKAISKVITVFPKSSGASKFKDRTYSDIVFVPIMPEDNKESIPYGYDYLKNEIESIMDDILLFV